MMEDDRLEELNGLTLQWWRQMGRDVRYQNDQPKTYLYFKTLDQKEVNAMMAVSIVYAAK